MKEHKRAIAKACLDGAETNSMNFLQTVETLIREGFESYAIDFRRATATFYLSDGDCLELPAHRPDLPIAATFDASAVQSAIREAQQQVAGYTYKGFCRKVAAAGCAAYIVSFAGRRALYIGRTAETHVERFPD
jgi:uncharacterized protein YbcV (DUF1398 family)